MALSTIRSEPCLAARQRPKPRSLLLVTHPQAEAPPPAPPEFTGTPIVVDKAALKPYLGQVCVPEYV